MIQLHSGEHFGVTKKRLKLSDCILMEAEYVPDVVVPWHYHENPYFFFHLKGRLTEVNKKKSFVCTPGTILFHHWQEAHFNTEFSTDASFFHVEFQKSWFQRCNIKHNFFTGSAQLENPILKSYFRKIHIESQVNDNVTPISIEGLLLQVFAEMMRYSDKQSSTSPTWVGKVRNIIHDIATENITLELLSNEAGIHPVHLSREFPKYFNATFGEYIRKIRLEKATELIINSNHSLSKIAYDCGFADQSHFIHAFKLANRITPLQYRKKFLK